jgi:hypothetical protein
LRGGSRADIDGDLAFAGGDYRSCKFLPITIEQRNVLSGARSENAAQMLRHTTLQDHLCTGSQGLVSK